MRFVFFLLTGTLFLIGCATPRWQIHEAAMRVDQLNYPEGNTDESSDQSYIEARNVILLDVHTGRSWYLATDSDKGYLWIKLEKVVESDVSEP